MRKNNGDDIKVVVMNPECIPAARKKMFDFIFNGYILKTDNIENTKKKIKSSYL